MWAAGKSAARHFLGKIAAAFPTLRRRPRVLLGVCGSVAAVKLPELAMRLSASAEVRLMLTASGKHFVENVAPSYNPAVWEKWLRMKHLFPVFEDKDEWAGYTDVGTDSVLHIELRKWADVVVVVPLSANTLAKIAGGICDNLLTCVLRAWDVGHKPVVLCPAMNTAMWQHPATARHLAICREDYHATVVEPVAKTLACGDTGKGALATVDDVVAHVIAAAGLEHEGPEGTRVKAADDLEELAGCDQ